MRPRRALLRPRAHRAVEPRWVRALTPCMQHEPTYVPIGILSDRTGLPVKWLDQQAKRDRSTNHIFPLHPPRVILAG